MQGFQRVYFRLFTTCIKHNRPHGKKVVLISINTSAISNSSGFYNVFNHGAAGDFKCNVKAVKSNPIPKI